MQNRDTQRSRVYRAEKAAFPDIVSGGLSLPECVAVFERVKSGSYYPFIQGYRRIPFGAGRGRRRGCYHEGAKRRIELPRFARTVPYVLHELAHACAERTVGDGVRHHASFCTHYLNLVYDVMGEEAARSLEHAFCDHRVLYRQTGLIYR